MGAIANWEATATATLRNQGYKDFEISKALVMITDEAYRGLAWKTLHKVEKYNDPYHERILAVWKAQHPDARDEGHQFVGNLFSEEVINEMFSDEDNPLDVPKD